MSGSQTPDGGTELRAHTSPSGPVSAAPEGDDLLRWHECERKQKFATFTEADQAAWDTMIGHPERNNGKTTNVGAYECSWCDGFHIGSRLRMTGQPRARRMQNARKKWAHVMGKAAASAASQPNPT